MEEEGPPQEVDAPSKPKEPEVEKEDISRIDRDLKRIKNELAGKAPYCIFGVLFLLLGGVGAGYLLNGFVFKSATWAGYLIGVGGTAIVAWLYKVYKQEVEAEAN